MLAIVLASRKEMDMTKLKRWTKDEVKELRSRAGRQDIRKIARKLRRSVGATQQKAVGLGISTAYHIHRS